MPSIQRIPIVALPTLLAVSGMGVFAFGMNAPKPRAKSTSPKISTTKATVTYAKDVAPILYKHCSGCHHPGEAAPFSLTSYADAAKRADLIADVTDHRIMPPWQPVPTDCTLANDISLKSSDVALLKAWAKTGMKPGKLSEAPKPPKFTPGWRLGKPDLVVSMSKPYHLAADGPDVYRNFVLPLHLDHDVWVKTIDFHPGNRTVTHHSLFFFDATGSAIKLDGEGGEPGFAGSMPTRAAKGPSLLSFMDSGSPTKRPDFGGLGGWAVGRQPTPMPGDYAFFLPKGSDLILSTHFHPDGKPETESSTVGLYFTNTPPSHGFIGLLLPVLFGVTSHIDIRPGQKAFTIHDEFVLPVTTTLINVGAHAHYLGKTFDLVAELPDGKTKNLFEISNWDFNWQGSYNFAPFVRLPAGTKLKSTITYDNTSENPHNPSNPPKEVFWGEQTTNEMGSILLSATADTPEDLATLKQGYVRHVSQAFGMRRPARPAASN